MGLSHTELKKRNEVIIALWKAHVSASILAKRYGLTRARIYQIVK